MFAGAALNHKSVWRAMPRPRHRERLFSRGRDRRSVPDLPGSTAQQNAPPHARRGRLLPINNRAARGACRVRGARLDLGQA